uniref:Uncharacterized protein n=1 Tax=Arundo donax TaxID=35708 RepID=A0A0A8Z9C9_ARUDO
MRPVPSIGLYSSGRSLPLTSPSYPILPMYCNHCYCLSSCMDHSATALVHATT